VLPNYQKILFVLKLIPQGYFLLEKIATA